MPRINPGMAEWARTVAGVDLDDAATRLKIRPARGVSPSDRLRAIEDGTAMPTRALLEAMVKLYGRPLITFYLDKAPKRASPMTKIYRSLLAVMRRIFNWAISVTVRSNEGDD
jgi:hypothetical protein